MVFTDVDDVMFVGITMCCVSTCSEEEGECDRPLPANVLHDDVSGCGWSTSHVVRERLLMLLVLLLVVLLLLLLLVLLLLRTVHGRVHHVLRLLVVPHVDDA